MKDDTQPQLQAQLPHHNEKVPSLLSDNQTLCSRSHFLMERFWERSWASECKKLLHPQCRWTPRPLPRTHRPRPPTCAPPPGSWTAPQAVGRWRSGGSVAGLRVGRSRSPEGWIAPSCCGSRPRGPGCSSARGRLHHPAFKHVSAAPQKRIPPHKTGFNTPTGKRLQISHLSGLTPFSSQSSGN